MIWLFPIFKATLGRWEYNRFQRFIRGLIQKRMKASLQLQKPNPPPSLPPGVRRPRPPGCLGQGTTSGQRTDKYAFQNEPPVPDVFSWILRDFNQNPKPSWQERENLYGDGGLIVVAGR